MLFKAEMGKVPGGFPAWEHHMNRGVEVASPEHAVSHEIDLLLRLRNYNM